MDFDSLCKKLAEIKKTIFDLEKCCKSGGHAEVKRKLYYSIRRVRAEASKNFHLFNASELFNEIDDRPVELETFMNAGCNVPEIATLNGSRMTEVHKQRLPLYRSIEDLPLFTQKIDDSKKQLKKVEGKFWRWQKGLRKSGLSWEDLSFINDLDNRGVNEVEELLIHLNEWRYGNVMRHFENKYDELFKLDSVQQGIDSGWLRCEFDRGMKCNDNHMHDGMPLGYLNIGRGLRRLAIKDGWIPPILELPDKADSEMHF